MKLRDDLIAVLEAENDALRERVRELELLCGTTFCAPPHLGLTPAEAKLFGMLLHLPLVRKDAVMSELYGMSADGDVAEPKIVDVFACKLRRKLKPFGISIETQWSVGYFMTPSCKEAARDQLHLWSRAA